MMGKHILITTFGSLGDLNPYIALSLGLKERGHTPVIATSEFYRSMVESAGIEFHPVRPDLNPNDTELLKRIFNPWFGAEILLREVVLPYLRESYLDLLGAVKAADLVITHPITFAGPIAAEKTNTPWISTILAPLSFFSAYDLPVLLPFPFLKNIDRFGPGVARAFLQFTKSVTRNWGEPVKRLRAELGLPQGGNPFYEGQFSPNGTLGLFSPLLAKPSPDWPPNTRITGFLFHDKRPLPFAADSTTNNELDRDLENFLRSGPPPVVFTLGSSAVMAAGAFYQTSLEAAKMMGVRAILLVGKDPRNRPSGKLPDGIAAFEYVPYRQIFPRAAAIVHQGGIGTTAQALRSGKPMLVVPFAFDQPDNGYRVTRLGVAGTLYRRRYTADRAAGELRTLLHNPEYAGRAAEVGQIVQAENGVATACEVILDF